MILSCSYLNGFSPGAVTWMENLIPFHNIKRYIVYDFKINSTYGKKNEKLRRAV
jgi:hypothetical protein